MHDPSSQGYKLLDAVKNVHLTQRRTMFKVVTVTPSVLCLLILSFFFLYDDSVASSSLASSSSNQQDPFTTVVADDITPRTKISLCDGYDKKSLPRLLASEAKYDDLIDDKFTIVIQTYKRPDILDLTLHFILDPNPKSLHSIIIVWNDLETPVPEDWVSKDGIPVHFRQSDANSLNQKLKADPNIKTKAVLLGDDDTYYTPEDLEFAFQIWRETGRNRLVGAWPRAGRSNEAGEMRYDIPGTSWDYNMVLTGLSFVHIAFLDYYWSDDQLMTSIRSYVDELFNCEDIALNYLTQHVTGCPSIWVKGKDGANRTPKPKDYPRIGQAAGHLSKRTTCLNEFKKQFGRNPLKMQYGFLVRGEIHAP